MAELLARIVLVVGGITSMAWHNHQPPRVGEHPAMIHALEGRRGYLALAADDRTAMGADVDQRVIFVLLVAGEEHRPPCALACHRVEGTRRYGSRAEVGLNLSSKSDRAW